MVGRNWRPVLAAASLVLGVLAAYASTNGAYAQNDAPYDLLVLRQDWPPSSCAKPEAQCTRPTFGAFGVYALVPTNIATDDPYQQGTCPGADFNLARIPANVREELSCVFYSGEGNDTALWENLWNIQGRCSGLTIREFFNAVIGAFHTYNANNPVVLAGITLVVRNWVDRDILLNSLQAIWGKKAWLACDPATRDLLYVSTCFLPIAPSDPWNLTAVDCPWDRNSPSSPGGAECAGLLRMRPGVAPTPQCQKYYPITIRGGFPDEPTASPPPPSPRLAPSPPPALPERSPPPVTRTPAPAPGPAPTPADPVKPQLSPLTFPSPSELYLVPSPDPLGMDVDDMSAGASSSTNIAVIVGSVAGAALAVAAAVALFVARRRAAAAKSRSGYAGSGGRAVQKSDSLVIPIVPVKGGSDTDSSPLSPPSDPSSLALLAAPARHPRDSPTAWLVGSYLGSPAGGSADYRGGLSDAGGSMQAQAGTGYAPQGAMEHGPGEAEGEDPFLSQIASVLTSVRLQHIPEQHLIPAYQQQQMQQQNAPLEGAAPAPPLPRQLSTVTSSNSMAPPSSLSWDVACWTVRWEQLQVRRLIGRGSFGKVYLAHWNATPVAVKVLIKADGITGLQSLELPETVMRQLQEEAAVMTRIRHPNLVSFLGLCTLPPAILTEYCPQGSLYDVLRRASRDPACALELTWRRRLAMAFDAARGLLYLHCRQIIHRDVKSPNLLVDEHWRVKVCDFNLAEILRQQQAAGTSARDGATNPIWLAPEVLTGRAPTAAADVYAFGLVMWELLAWRLPWDTRSAYQVRRHVLEGGRPEVPAADALPGPAPPPPAALDAYCCLMRECWRQDPRERPTCADIVGRLSMLLE